MTLHTRMTLTFVVCALCAAGCKGKSKNDESKNHNQPASRSESAKSPDQRAAPTLPAQEADEKALAAQIEALVAETDPIREKQMIESLRLPDAKAWFEKAFGAKAAATLAAQYDKDGVLPGLAKTIRYHRNKFERKKMIIEKYSAPDDADATGLQARAMAAMVTPSPTPLYSIRFSAPARAATLHLYNFIHDGQRFRYVGPLIDLGSGEPTSTELATLRMRQRDLARSPK